MIIGDLDSITSATRSYFQTARFIHITRQDSTDLEKALSFARSNGVARVTILGATGKRIDFTLGNLSVLWRYTRRLAITVAGDGWLAATNHRAHRPPREERNHHQPHSVWSLLGHYLERTPLPPQECPDESRRDRRQQRCDTVEDLGGGEEGEDAINSAGEKFEILNIARPRPSLGPRSRPMVAIKSEGGARPGKL